MPELIIVADDLTGALDSSSAFACRGAKVAVALSPAAFEAELLSDADIVAVSTNSRELKEKEVVSAMAPIFRALDKISNGGQGPALFKKIDSRLKGHIVVETNYLRKVDGPVILCSAIPNLGRIVQDGRISGAGVDVPISVKAEISGLDARTPDAKTDADLDQMVADAPHRALFAGASGLSAAIARASFGRGVTAMHQVLPGPAVFAIGSRDPVTLSQLEGLEFAKAPNGIVPPSLGTEGNHCIVRMMPGHSQIDDLAASENFANGVAEWLRQTDIRTLFACGGETATAILRELDIQSLNVVGEILPGIPVSEAIYQGKKLMVVTKSGGFGEHGTLKTLVDIVSGPYPPEDDCHTRARSR